MILCALPRASRHDDRGFTLPAEGWFSAADREMQAETYSHLLMKELMALAAGLPTQDREDIAAGGFASYPLCQRHTSSKWGSSSWPDRTTSR
jgi:hypothetical protein